MKIICCIFKFHIYIPREGFPYASHVLSMRKMPPVARPFLRPLRRLFPSASDNTPPVCHAALPVSPDT
jgi:hypothetical protein